MANQGSAKRYRAILTAKPGTKLPNKVKLELNFPEPEGDHSKVMVENILEIDPTGIAVPSGLRFIVEVSASSLDSALGKAASLADGVASYTSISVRVGLPVVRQELVYEITPDIHDREFLQLFHELPADLPQKSANPELVVALMEKAIEENDERKRERITRAVRWYRKGAVSSDVLDRFISYWTGFEALNPILQDVFSVNDQPQSSPTISGIRAFLQKSYPGDLYKRAHELRVELVHSTKPLSTLTGEAASLEAQIGEALRRSIHYLLGLETEQQATDETPSASIPVTMAFVGTIHGDDPDALGPVGEHPRLEVAHHDVVGTTIEGTKIERTVTSTFNSKTREGVTFSIGEWRLYGPAGATGKLKDVRVTPKDGRPKT